MSPQCCHAYELNLNGYADVYRRSWGISMAATHTITDQHPLKGLSLVETTELARLSKARGAANDEDGLNFI
jgi:hypothetical protein